MSRRGILAVVGAVVVLVSGGHAASAGWFSFSADKEQRRIAPDWWRGAPESLLPSAATKPLSRSQRDEAEQAYLAARVHDLTGDQEAARWFYREIQEKHEGCA